MTEPKVLDANGNPLAVGSRVQRSFGNGYTGGMPGEVLDIATSGVCVAVVAFTAHAAVRFPLRRRFTLRPSFCCNDLELIDQYDKEESRGD